MVHVHWSLATPSHHLVSFLLEGCWLVPMDLINGLYGRPPLKAVPVSEGGE